MRTLRALVVVGSLGLVVAAFTTSSRGAVADRPAACQQWEVMLAPAVRSANDSKPLPEMGKPFVEVAPPGWEPFAFGPTGQLVFRRCAR